MEVHQVELDYLPARRSRWVDIAHAPPSLEEVFRSGRRRYASQLEIFLAYADPLKEIPGLPAEGSPELAWVNEWFNGVDIAALYGYVRSRRPSRYVEIGSGMSTRVARRAVDDGGIDTEIVSIDPEPRSDVDGICDRRIPARLEDLDPGFFDEIEPGDIVFLDGSHRVLMNSDVVVFFFEVLPRLPAGTLVQIHDVFLPYDYPSDWIDRYYSEQFLLAGWLMGGGEGIEILFPSRYVTFDTELFSRTSDLWTSIGLERPEHTMTGSSFWFRTTGRTERPRSWIGRRKREKIR